MRRTAALLSLFAVVLFGAADWRQFRGENGASVAKSAPPPITWSDSENVAFKSKLPGGAASGPIVVDGRVIVTAATGFKQDRLHVLAFDAKTGEELWHRQFWATGRTLCHPFSSVAANTPASDGKQVYAFFSSNDLVCLDLDGNLKWFRGLTNDYPAAANDVGMASSPVVLGNTVVVQVENEGTSFAAGLSTADGSERWKVARKRQMNWTSPAVLGKPQGSSALVLLQSADVLSAHDPATGEELWKYEGDFGTIASPLTQEDVIYAPADGGLAAIKSGALQPQKVWGENKLSPGSASPVLHDGKIYVLKRDGVLSCGSASDGKILWQLRLKGPFWATPVAVGKYLFCLNSEGLGQVVDVSGEKGEIVAQNDLGEEILGSPAIVDGSMYIRGKGHLWKIAAP